MIKRRYEHLLVTSYITYYLLRLLAKNFKDRVHFQRVSGHYHRSHPNFLLQLSKEFDGCRNQFFTSNFLPSQMLQEQGTLVQGKLMPNRKSSNKMACLLNTASKFNH